ncbi:hypothetical protein J2809_001723 [Arthrobacter pascens]|nr:hypothetical protein [Arthrobacter pascens]
MEARGTPPHHAPTHLRTYAPITRSFTVAVPRCRSPFHVKHPPTAAVNDSYQSEDTAGLENLIRRSRSDLDASPWKATFNRKAANTARTSAAVPHPAATTPFRTTTRYYESRLKVRAPAIGSAPQRTLSRSPPQRTTWLRFPGIWADSDASRPSEPKSRALSIGAAGSDASWRRRNVALPTGPEQRSGGVAGPECRLGRGHLLPSCPRFVV